MPADLTLHAFPAGITPRFKVSLTDDRPFAATTLRARYRQLRQDGLSRLNARYATVGYAVIVLGVTAS